MPVLFQTQVRVVRFRHDRLLRLAQGMLSHVGESASELGLTFIGDQRMRRLNHRFRNKDRATDVLAFAAREARLPHGVDLSARLLGDVVISVPTAMRQAKEGQRSLDQELVALMIHGILHLCGYDHERSDSEARRMERRERVLLKRLGNIPRFVHHRPSKR
ncbi:rRNA maturation RNase YbeY [Petrachloros mirabilis]